jgi:hypothetical protein
MTTLTTVPCGRTEPHMAHENAQHDEGGVCPGVLCECGATTDLLHDCDASDRFAEK